MVNQVQDLIDQIAILPTYDTEFEGDNILPHHEQLLQQARFSLLRASQELGVSLDPTTATELIRLAYTERLQKLHEAEFLIASLRERYHLFRSVSRLFRGEASYFGLETNLIQNYQSISEAALQELTSACLSLRNEPLEAGFGIKIEEIRHKIRLLSKLYS